MNFFSRLKLAFNNSSFEDHIRRFMAGEGTGDGGNVAGITVNADTALKYSAVFGCCRVLAESFASVPFMFYKKRPDGDRDRVTEGGLFRIFHDMPNPDMSSFNLHETLMYNLNLGGNFYADVKRSRVGEPVQLIPYMYPQVEMDQNKETRRIEYKIDDPGGTFLKKVMYKPNIFHVPGLSLNGLKGMSPISYAAGAVKLGLTYENFTTNFYHNGAFPAGFFKHPGHLRDDAYTRLNEDLKKRYQGVKNGGRPMLLESGLEYQGLTITPMDSQLLESKKFQIEDVCRIYRVPLHLVQNLDKATNNNIEHQSLEFVMYTMLPWFRRVEAAINTQLLTTQQKADGFFVEYNMAGLLRGDQKSMADAFAQGRQWGWLSVNDIRRLLNLNGIGEKGDIYLQPMNMTDAGDPTPAPAPAAPAAPDDSGEPGDPDAAVDSTGGKDRPIRPSAQVLDEIHELIELSKQEAV